jgi:NitT/TauT family transport system substrate-binding protein
MKRSAPRSKIARFGAAARRGTPASRARPAGFAVIAALALSAVAAVSLAPCAAHGAARQTAVKIAMGYIPNVQFAPYYVAFEKGYFEEEGLDVSFDYGMSTDIMSLVAQGLVHFGISDGDQVILAREKGIPVRVVYSMYVRYPVGVVSLKERGIADAASLRGRRVGMPVPYGSNYIGLQIILGSAGLGLKDIKAESIGYTQVESVLAGRVDAAAIFINNEPVVLAEMGKEILLIRAHDITPMVSAAVIASDALIGKDPELVRRFVRAVTRASEHVLDRRGEVVDMLRKHVPTLTDENVAINTKVLLASLDLWTDGDTEKNGLGYTSNEDWGKSIAALKALGMLKTPVRPEECYTDRFIARPH